jgi:hypothetical protein
MALPKPIGIQTINGLKADGLNYESHKRLLEGYNNLIAALSPGKPIAPQNIGFTGMGTGATTIGVSGTFLRGSLSMKVGTVPAPNPSVSLNFPTGTFSEVPFAIVTQNGGTGSLKFTFAATVNSLAITLIGTPSAGDTYTFSFSVRE